MFGKSLVLYQFNNAMVTRRLSMAIIFCCLIFVVGYSFFHFSSFLSFPGFNNNYASPVSNSQFLYGVNMSGGEFGEKNLPGKLYTDYIYPHDNLDFRYFSAKHVSVIRLPIRWERIQPTAFGPLSTT
ncbi:MAG TPA: hypothetical protein VLG12_08615, partial [Candidatus Saccharimonadales bacterium]|nr:hypothetical protein [Candidatus Saccharimonadales bacterium]